MAGSPALRRRHALSLIPQPRLQFRKARGVRFKRAGARQFLRRLSAPPQVDQRPDAIAPPHGFIRLQRDGAVIGGDGGILHYVLRQLAEPEEPAAV